MALAALAILITLFGIFFKKAPIKAEEDFERIFRNILFLEPEQTIPIPLTDIKYSIYIFGEGYEDQTPKEKCGGKTCLCLIKDQKTKCKILKGIKKECPKASEKCAKENCFEKNTLESFAVGNKYGETIKICKKCNGRISIQQC